MGLTKYMQINCMDVKNEPRGAVALVAVAHL